MSSSRRWVRETWPSSRMPAPRRSTTPVTNSLKRHWIQATPSVRSPGLRRRLPPWPPPACRRMRSCISAICHAKASERQEFLGQVANLHYTLVFLETPHRLLDSLADLESVLGDRPMAAARELTKVYEQFVRGHISQVWTHFTENEPRGEFVLVVSGTAVRGSSKLDRNTGAGCHPRRAAEWQKVQRNCRRAGGTIRLEQTGCIRSDQ